MKFRAQLGSWWLLLVLCAQPVSHGEEAPKWEIKTRTLAHAPDGSPDTRSDWGIGEWVELKVVPESAKSVEWEIKGSARVSNRFGNPTLLMVGYGKGDGPISIGAYVNEPRHPARPVPEVPADKKAEAAAKRKNQRVTLESLSSLTDKPQEFDAACSKIYEEEFLLFEDLDETQPSDLSYYTKTLPELDRLAVKAPGSSMWAGIQRSFAEAAALRLAAYLDRSEDKSQLDQKFWDLLHALVTNMQSLHRQYEAAGGKANSMARIGGMGGMTPEARRNGVANALHSGLPRMRYLLFLQVRNAFPGVPVEKVKEGLLKQSFTQAEADFLLDALVTRSR